MRLGNIVSFLQDKVMFPFYDWIFLFKKSLKGQTFITNSYVGFFDIRFKKLFHSQNSINKNERSSNSNKCTKTPGTSPSTARIGAIGTWESAATKTTTMAIVTVILAKTMTKATTSTIKRTVKALSTLTEMTTRGPISTIIPSYLKIRMSYKV